ncbi:MAG: hypothetical protein ACOC4K_01120 [Verrucomicrobiota bacterium]
MTSPGHSTATYRGDLWRSPFYGVLEAGWNTFALVVAIRFFDASETIKLWGHVFDKLHFVTMRNALNCCFLLSIGLFFFTDNLYLLGLSMACQGLAMGGGKIFWSLWVTKIAEPAKAASYMSVHMALTGLRGSLAPFIGYWIFAGTGPTTVAVVGISLVAVSMGLFECVRGHHRLRET